ncbi:MAG TPA: TIGR04222 domain-containing membrane protein [Pseudonocardiaceae bacterium]|nr:TIGR04222 domain-containing membrane protein [Pseudonocardiaceae bacterium]
MLWGILGSQFLVIYAAALAVTLVVAIALRWRARRPSSPAPDRPLTVADLGLLAGGAYLAVGAVIAELVAAGKARVSGGGSVMATSTASNDPVEAEVLHELAGAPQPVVAVVTEVANGSAVLTIRDDLADRGLVVSRAMARAVRLWPAVALYALAAVAVVRHISAVRLGYPVGILTLLLILNLVLAAVVHRRRLRLRTVHGDRVLAAARADRPDLANPWLDSAVHSAGGRVAVEGLSAFPEATIRRELTHGAIMIGMAAGAMSGAGGSGGST